MASDAEAEPSRGPPASSELSWGLGLQDRLRWQASLAPQFASEVWTPFRATMAAQLHGGHLSPAHAARARRLLDAGVTVRPLTPDVVELAAAFIVRQGLGENPLMDVAGLTSEEYLERRRAQLGAMAAVGDPLSATIWVGDELHGTFLCRDAGPPDAMRAAAAAAVARPALTPQQRSLACALQRVDTLLIDAARPERPDVDRWLELVGGATSDLLRVFLRGPGVPPEVGRTLRDAFQPMMVGRIARSGVYTHLFAHAHERSLTPSAAVLAQEWRRRTGAPERMPDWDVHLVLPYADLGMTAATDKSLDNAMHAVVVQVRPRTIHRWRPVTAPPASVL